MLDQLEGRLVVWKYEVWSQTLKGMLTEIKSF